MLVLAVVMTVAAAAMGVAFAAGPAAGEKSVIGTWLSEDKDGVIEIYQAADGSLEGRIVSGKHPDRLDDHNPDPALRTRKLIGTVIMKGMRPDGDQRWSGGTIYDPNNGKTYRCKMTLTPADVLELRGYIGVSLFGRSTRWTRTNQ